MNHDVEKAIEETRKPDSKWTVADSGRDAETIHDLKRKLSDSIAREQEIERELEEARQHQRECIEAKAETENQLRDLEFTREEVRGMIEEAFDFYRSRIVDVDETVEHILSRHTEGCAVAEEEAVKRYGPNWRQDETPAIKASEIDAEHNPEIPWPDPKSSDLVAEDFNLIWDCIKRWDINVPEAYEGYCGATGNHVMQILFALGWRDITDYWENGGSIPEPQHTLDREVGEIQGELIELTKRVADIEKRVLADGHSHNCQSEKYMQQAKRGPFKMEPVPCDCGYDKLRRMKGA